MLSEISGTLAPTSSCGVKPALVRSPPLLAPSTSVIVAKLSNNCFEPSAFFAKAHAVLACVRVDESDLVAKDAVSYDFLGVEARGAVLLRDLGRHRRKQLRGRQLGRREGPAGERESYHAINALVVPSEGQTPRHAPSEIREALGLELGHTRRRFARDGAEQFLVSLGFAGGRERPREVR